MAGRHAAVAERQQRLVERVPLRLDVEVDVVDVGRERAQALDLAVDRRVVLHRQPLIGGAGLGHERVDAADDAADVPAALGVPHHDVAHLQRLIADRHEVVVGLGGDADHVIELQVLHPRREDHLGGREDLVVGDRLVDHAAQAVGSDFRRDRDGALAARAQQVEDGRRQVVEPQRRRADAVAHLRQAREDLLDVRVIAQRDRHEAGAIRIRPRRLGQLQDALLRETTRTGR